MRKAAMRSHEIEYQIYGDDMQFVEVRLDPGETAIGEAGAMMYMNPGISFEAKMGDGSNPDEGMWGKLKSAGKRVLAQESLFLTHFTNNGHQPSTVSFAAEFPGKIVAADLAQLNGSITCQKDAFLCAALGTRIDIAFNRKIGTGLFGGEGFILQRLTGDGMAFLAAGGTIVRRDLRGETLRVDTGCIVAFTDGVTYGIERAGNLKSNIFGGEGIFLATLSGYGSVWLQSLPFSRLADKVLMAASNLPGTSQGEGSAIGAFSTMFER